MTARGKFVLTLLILGLAGFGAYQWWDRLAPAALASADPASASASVPASAPATAVSSAATAPASVIDDAEFVAPLLACPLLPPPAAYVAKDNTIDLELSEYAGYAGIIAANGGLEPTENSVFFRKHGFKVRITLSEEESWPALNAGRIAASATTVDVLTAYCRNFAVTAPVQIGFSRGADGLVVRKDIRRINDLRGKTLVTAQFTEADFFLRYLTQEAGIEVNLLSSPADTPAADKVNLLFASDAFAAGDLFLKDLTAGGNLLAGCVTWAPKTTEVVEASGGRAQLLTTNKNLLIIADILIVNRGFAEANPKIVAGLVDGVLEGNRLVRDQPATQLDLLARAFKWSRDEVRDELAKVHLSNLPENLAFYAGTIDSAGSFSGIFSSALLAYGSLIDQPTDADKYMAPAHLTALQAAGAYAEQRVAIAPIRSAGGGALEGDPLLTKDIRFLFEPNSAILQMGDAENAKNLESIRRLLQVSPGSTILLRGHVDNALVEKFRQQGGDAFVRQMALKAMELSKNRANEIRRVLIERLQVSGERLETIGRGWEEPAGADAELNRRVEVQWFTVE
ncbi:MAG: phosphate ABC transporter substrate-binding/OmpA family protein [Opitutaceae bacterium]|jgi:NitT/TauT family transport system substrate-binding protein|nr:phosphate ABC transporter substrate-binding/OmpA family protein [Opitutaceae bacterium]